MITVTPYDFKRNESLDRHQTRALNAALDSFARHGSIEISSSLRRACQLSLKDISEVTWKQIVTKLGEKPYMATFTVDPLQGRLLVAMPLVDAIRIIDYRLGGGNLPAFERHTDPTDTDLAVLGGIIEPLFTELGSAFSRHAIVRVSLITQEATKQYVQIAGQLEVFLQVEMELMISDEVTIPIYMHFPIILIRQIIQDLQSYSEDKEESVRSLDQEVILKTPISLWMEIPPIPLTPEAVSGLSPGDIIPFFHPTTEPLDIRAEGVLVAKGKQYAIGSKVVCSISEEVNEDDN